MNNVKIKPSFSEERHILGHIYPITTPFTVILDAADVCNFKCYYCFRHTSSRSNSGIYGTNTVMSWEVFTRAVEQIKEFPGEVKQISLSHHGEPLCNKLLPNMLSYIREAGLTGRTSIHTNASLLTCQLADELVRSGLGRMVVSLQGLTSEQYNEHCGVSLDFKKFYANISYLYKHKGNMELDIKIIDSALGKKTKEEFCDLFLPIADRVFVEQEVPLWANVDFTKKDYSNKYGALFSYQRVCPLVFHTSVISASGYIHSCTHLTPPLAGKSLHETTLKGFWDCRERKEFLRKMLEDGRENIPICKNCYIPQNSVYSEKDIIDGFQAEILERLRGACYSGQL